MALMINPSGYELPCLVSWTGMFPRSTAMEELLEKKPAKVSVSSYRLDDGELERE